MKRREFIPMTAFLPMIANQTAAFLSDPSLAEPRYEELLRNTALLADAQYISDDLVNHLLQTIANIDPRETATTAVFGFAKIAVRDTGLLAEIDQLLSQVENPKDALNLIEANPDLLFQLPAVQSLSELIGNTIKSDATLFLNAADLLLTGDAEKHLPANMPIERNEAEMAKESQVNCPVNIISIIVATIIIIVAIILAVITYGNTLIVSGQILAASMIVGATVASATGNDFVRQQMTEAEADFYERMRKLVSRRSVLYARAARKVAQKCLKLENPAERRACLEAALLLCANAY